MAITKVELANMLLGVESTKKAAAKIKTSTIVGTAHNDSHDGYVLVDLGGDVISVDGKQYVSLATTSDVRAGDKVYVMLRGADGTAMGATIIGAAGGGDRTKGDIAAATAIAQNAEATVNSVKATADAHESQIDAIQKDIEAYKKSATATYATKTDVDEKTGAITKTIEADYTKTSDLGSTAAVKDAKSAGTTAQSQLSSYKSSNDKAVADAKSAGVIAQSQLSSYKKSNDQAVADAKSAGTTAQSQLADYKESNDAAVATAKKSGDDAAAALADYKGVVTETYAEKTELTEAVNQLSSTMTSNYSAFTDYRQSNDAALSKAQTDATNAQSTIDSYKSSNDKAVADAKSAGTTAQNQLSSYKSSNDAAVKDAKKAGTDAQSQLGSYKTATDQRLDELKNIADNAIESFYLKGAPTTSNAPAKDWTTDALRRQHAGDLYMDTDTGYSYRWSGTAWVQVKDSDVTKALREIAGIKTDYATKSELKATDTELSGKVSDALTTAKSYTDGSVQREATARDAAIKAQADSISLSVSKTYTKYETFSAYQSDADSRIATANSNASTAVSTAKTAASDAATAKTNASTAVSTANSASASAANAVKTANAASSSAASAVETANSASSTASAASTTASKASTDAVAAVKTANTASSNASTAVTTANGAVTTANAASSTASAAKTTAEDAASTASSAKSAADSASSTAKAASTSASNAVSTAQTAKTTAQTAKTTADTAKSTADAVNRAAVKTYPYPNSLGVSNWVHLGDWSNTQDSHTLKIDLLSGSGYNAGTSQNSTVEIFVKDGSQSTASATNAYGATVTLGQLNRSKCHVDVIAASATSCSIWIKLDFVYDAGSYTVAMTPGDSWTHSGAVSSTEPTGTKQKVAFLTNAEEANAAAGAAQTSANSAQKAADKAQSSADDTAAALAKAAVRIRIDGTPMADGTSQLMAHVYVGNDEVSASAIAKLGTLVWKMDGVADRRGTTTYTAQTGKFVTCRLEA